MMLPLHLGNSVGLGLCSADCPIQLPYVFTHFFVLPIFCLPDWQSGEAFLGRQCQQKTLAATGLPPAVEGPYLGEVQRVAMH